VLILCCRGKNRLPHFRDGTVASKSCKWAKQSSSTGVRISILKTYMAKNRGNPNWGKPDANFGAYTGPSSFEEIVKTLRLSPGEYQHSVQLKEWVKKNKDQKYVPSSLLQVWKMGVRGES
jgi:hypothetical protein